MFLKLHATVLDSTVLDQGLGRSVDLFGVKLDFFRLDGLLLGLQVSSSLETILLLAVDLSAEILLDHLKIFFVEFLVLVVVFVTRHLPSLAPLPLLLFDEFGFDLLVFRDESAQLP